MIRHIRPLARTRMRSYDDWKADDGTDSDEGLPRSEAARIHAWIESTVQCPDCKGSGWAEPYVVKCPCCNGRKRLPKESA